MFCQDCSFDCCLFDYDYERIKYTITLTRTQGVGCSSWKHSAIKCHAIKCQMWGVVQMYTDIRKELAEGGRAYFVYPLVEESTSEIMASVKVTQPSQYFGSRAGNQAKPRKVYRMPFGSCIDFSITCSHMSAVVLYAQRCHTCIACMACTGIRLCSDSQYHAIARYITHMLISSHLAASLAGT